jgi:hypothetical protein
MRQTTSCAAGNCLVTTAKYLRRTTSGAAGNGLGTTTKYLRRTTSGAVGSGLSRYRELLMCPFTTSAPHSLCFVRASFANEQNSTAEVRDLGAQCVCLCVGPEQLVRLSGLARFASKWTGPGQTKLPSGGSLCARRCGLRLRAPAGER